jgi:hypothetical protein
MILAFKAAAIGASENFFMGLWYTANNVDRGFGITTHGTADVYVCGRRSDGTRNRGILLKIDQTPDVLWARDFTDSANSVDWRSVATDGTQVFVSGYIPTVNGTPIVEYDTSGTVTLQRRYARTSSSLRISSLHMDGSNNVTFGGSCVDLEDMMYGEMSGTGTNTLGKFYDLSLLIQGWGHWVDSSNNFYVSGTGSLGYGYLMKADSSGVHQWTTRYGGGTHENYAIIGTAAGETYVMTRFTSGTAAVGLCKYNSSGSLLWQRKLAAANDMFAGLNIGIDSDENVYICGVVNSSPQVGFIAKYNSSGTIQWQRTLASGDGNFAVNAVTCDTNKNLYVVGTCVDGGLDRGFIGKFPADGSLTGTYSFSTVNVTYGVSTYTTSTPTEATTSQAGTTMTNLTFNTPTMTSATVTATDEWKAL